MARSKFSNRLNKIAKYIETVPSQEIEELAKAGVNNAKQLLVEATSIDGYTQKHGEELADYIEYERKNPNEYVITAGEYADEEIRLELYYAEYGAGLTLSPRANTVSSGYIEIPNNRYSPKDDGHFKKDPNGDYWWYPNADIGDRKGRKFGNFTDRSVPIEYMYQTRQMTKEQLKRTSKKIRTNIKRIWSE